MEVGYSVEELRSYSQKLISQCSSMSSAILSLNGLTGSFQEHWSGEAQAAYLGFFSTVISSMSAYVAELEVIARNLNTAADYYEAHEAKYEPALW